MRTPLSNSYHIRSMPIGMTRGALQRRDALAIERDFFSTISRLATREIRVALTKLYVACDWPYNRMCWMSIPRTHFVGLSEVLPCTKPTWDTLKRHIFAAIAASFPRFNFWMSDGDAPSSCAAHVATPTPHSTSEATRWRLPQTRESRVLRLLLLALIR